MMVLRVQKINNRSDNVQLHCSFGLPDVKELLRLYASMVDEDYARGYQESEKDVRFWLEHDGRAFLSWPPKWREQLSSWCFAVAIRNKLLIPTAADENKYFLADCLFAKRGRPKKKD